MKKIGRQHGHNMENVDLVLKLKNDSVLNVRKQLWMMGLLLMCFPQVETNISIIAVKTKTKNRILMFQVKYWFITIYLSMTLNKIIHH